MSAAVAGTFSRFRPTRSYTNPRDVTRPAAWTIWTQWTIWMLSPMLPRLIAEALGHLEFVMTKLYRSA